MARHVAAVLVALCLGSVSVSAQTTVFKITATAAKVRKAPSTASPVIGLLPSGAVLEVTRDLGSWVKIVWPKGENGAGYVHVSTGTNATAATPPQRRTNGSAAPAPAASSSTAARSAAPVAGASAPPPPVPARSVSESASAIPPGGYIRPPEHNLGVGARVGTAGLGIGVAARGWSHARVGLQVELSRSTLDDGSAQFAALQFAPSILYALPDHVSDYWWVRPYIGAGVSLQHRTSRGVLPDGTNPLSETHAGLQAFGGGEVTFSSLPRFAVSADVGYRQPPVLTGLESGGFGVVVSGHWYLR